MPIGDIDSMLRSTMPLISSKMGIAWMSSGKQNKNKYRRIFILSVHVTLALKFQLMILRYSIIGLLYK